MDYLMRKAMFAFCFICFFLSSCQESSHSKQQVRVNLVTEPSSFDPVLARNLSSLFMARHLHEGLFRYEGEKIVQALAQGVSVSSDRMQYTISLKEANFSDGSKIKACDFVNTLKRALSKDTPSDYAHLAFIIKNASEIKAGAKEMDELGVCALDDHTLVFTLKNPYEDFLALLAHPLFYPIKKVGDNMLYSGPFVLNAKVPNSHVELVKNEKYHEKEKVKLQKISGFFISNETAALMLEKHEIDFIGSPLGAIPQECLEDFSKKDLLYFYELLATCFIRINTTKKGLEDASFRLFLSNAISRKSIVDSALAKRHLETISFVPKSLNLDGKSPSSLPFKVESVPTQLTLKYSSSDTRMQKVACIIKQSLEKALSLEIHLMPKEMKMLVQDLASLNYDLMLGSWIADVKDPENFLELFKDKSLGINGTGWESASFKKFLELAKYEPSLRLAHLAQAEKILLSECPIIPLFQYNMIYAKDKNLEGVSLNSLGILDFKTAFRK
jgi:oligopeptide transport system substrate-binding protein